MSMNDIFQTVLGASGFDKLNPLQEDALRTDFLRGKNLVLAAATASGKTLVAEIAALNVINQRKKVVYIVPLKALASEKYEEFKEKYEPMGIKIALSIGDLDQSDLWLERYDLIIVTSEKMDSLMRHGIPWIDSIGLVVADEIHLLNDPGRGPTLEVILTKIRELVNPQILALSATINNYEEIAKWLNADAVKSDYRPVELYKGIHCDKKVYFKPKKKTLVTDDEHIPSLGLAKDAVVNGKQVIIFASTRKNAEANAEKMGEIIKQNLKPDDLRKLKDLAGRVLGSVEHSTSQCEKLAHCVSMGSAFHHAGLVQKQRSLIENAFKEGLIKMISATPTLAAGINLPAWRVVIKDLKRFNSGFGMDYIPVLEIQQMMGRAGRPKYDKEGEAILIAKNEKEAEFLWNSYIDGEPEDIKSKLGVEPILRMHVLALTASNVVSSKQELFDFFSKTFYAFQYKDLSNLKNKLENVLKMLEKFKFIEIGGKPSDDNPFRKASYLEENSGLKPTLIGKRVSDLYIDPLTANYLITHLQKAEKTITDLGLLQLVSNTLEMRPPLSIRKGDFEKIDDILSSEGQFLLEKPPNPWDLEYDDYLRSLKTALMFRTWIEESGEDMILDEFNVTPGELRTRLDNADWLLYSTQELGILLGLKDLLRDIRKVRLRVKYGIREELLPLVRLRGVGRVRARILFNNGIINVSTLKKIPLETLSRLIGAKTAQDVKKQVEEDKIFEQEIL